MKNKNVILIRCEPKSGNVFSTFSHPGLALPIIGTVLENNGFHCRIYIEAIRPVKPHELDWGDLFAFTLTSASFMETYEFAKEIKHKTGKPIIFGGPHVTFLPDEALEFCDFVVRGEGEETIVELMNALNANVEDFSTIKGLSWKDKTGKHIHNEDRGAFQAIDIVPDQSLIVGFEAFNHSWKQSIMRIGMLVSTSRGCPFKCTFCSIPGTAGSQMRFRDIDSIIADIKQQIAFSGHPYIYMADDNFTVNRRRTKELLQAIVDAGLNIKFSAQVRADACRDNKLMDLLKAAGCYLVFIGMESINDDTLNEFQKGPQTRSLLENSARKFQQRGIMVHGMFVLGADHDAAGSAQMTAQWAVDNGLESIQMLPVCPLPGTQIMDKLEAEGRLYKAWNSLLKKDCLNYGAGSFVIHKPQNISAIQLQKDLMAAYEIFYGFSKVIKALWMMPSGKKLEPWLYRLLGYLTYKATRPQLEKHINWLKNTSDESKALAGPQIMLRNIS